MRVRSDEMRTAIHQGMKHHFSTRREAMNLRITSLAASLVLAASFNVVAADSLAVGDSAPPLTVSKWVKGEKIDRLEPGQTYVVEFWATWCGPCRASIPHLTSLQKKYKDKGVKFLGVSVWEQDQKEVEPFVKEMGDKMDYSVAMDDVPKGAENGKMADAWMKAAEADGIPAAFIVRDKKVAWIGHPMNMDEPLAKVVSGDYDLAAAASKYREQKALTRKLRAVAEKLNDLDREKQTKGVIAVIDKAIADEPKLEKSLGTVKFLTLLQFGDAAEARAYGDTLVDKATADESEQLNQIAWAYVDPDSKRKNSKDDLKLALKAATRASALTHDENAPILDTLAKVHFDSGNLEKALELQEKAVKLAPDGDQSMKDRLEQYRKAVKEKK
jgi:thiol-disulfide isomerase/thioredoxin